MPVLPAAVGVGTGVEVSMIKPEECNQLTVAEAKQITEVENDIDMKLRYHDFETNAASRYTLPNGVSAKVRNRLAALYSQYWKVEETYSNGYQFVFTPKGKIDWKALREGQPMPAEAEEIVELPEPVRRVPRTYDFTDVKEQTVDA